ncbi:MAG: hypothetical protein E7625_03530 [Ruminococcaceae bacterium]|nr:hypothetical protein [Oscillospiraceae bacterium]
MKRTTKVAVLLLLAVLFCLQLLACKQPETPGGEVPPSINPPSERVEPDIEKKDYNGTFSVLHYTTTNHEWTNPWDEIVPASGMETRPGDLIGNDIFERAAWLEQEYGITVTNEYIEYTKLPTTMSTIKTSGGTEYQLLATMGRSAQVLMGKGYFFNMAEIPGINFENPWWNDSALEALSLGDYVEFAVSDMLLIDKSATMAMYYNIPMANDLQLDGFYDAVRDYEWTIERLAEYAEVGLQPDGDDDWDMDDVYGIVANDDPVHALYIGSGNRFMEKDENGNYYYSYGTGDTMLVMTDLLTDIMYADFYWNSYVHAESPDFASGGSLFTFDKVKRCMKLREMQDDYGVLPIPMYSEDQKQYYSLVSNYHDSMFAVINTNVNSKELIGAALELMGYYSYYEIYNDFYDVVIQNRGTRDEESKRMLQLIFETRTYDMGLVYDPYGNTANVIRITGTQSSDVASQWSEMQSKREDTERELEELIKQFNGNS